VTGATVILGILVQVASATQADDAQRVGLMLVAAMLALGILEHWFLVLPFSEESLWRWALRSSKAEEPGEVPQRSEDRDAESGRGPGEYIGDPSVGGVESRAQPLCDPSPKGCTAP
jgi:hypothetical protein